MNTPTSSDLRRVTVQEQGPQGDFDTAIAPSAPPSLAVGALLELSDDALHDLFVAAPANWAREIDEYERTLNQSSDQPASGAVDAIERVRDALRAAMWTHDRWVMWKVE